MSPDEKDIRDVMEAEKRRGSRRKPLDAETLSKLRRFRQELREVLESGDERDLMRIIAELDWKEGSTEIDEILKVFRALRGGVRRSR